MTTSRRLAIVENKDREGLALPIGEAPEGAIDWEFIEAMTAVSGPFKRRVVEMNAAPTDAEIEAMAEKLWDVWRESGMTALSSDFDWSGLKGEAALCGDFAAVSDSMLVAAFRAMARVALEGSRD